MSLMVLLAPAELIAQVPEWHREVVVRANYGDKQDEYGYAGIADKKEPEGIGPVSVFYVGDKNIWIEDYYQGNIKEYDLSGRFLRAITLERGRPRKVGDIMIAPPLHNISDLLICEGVIYLLCEGGGAPPLGQANVYVYAHDLATGKTIEKIIIYNPRIGCHNREGGFTYGAASFAVGEEDEIFISDGSNGVSIPIVRDGKAVPAAEHAREVPGLVLGSRRVIFNEKMGRQELQNADASIIRSIDFPDSNVTWGNLMTTDLKDSSKNGDYIVTCKALQADFTISTWDGQDIGHVTWEAKEGWWTYPIQDLIQIGPDGAFYQVYPDSDAVYVNRWSK